MTIIHPKIPKDYKDDLRVLLGTVVKCVDVTVSAARAYFRDFETVRDYLHKIHHYESESDAIAIRLKTAVFASDLPLDRKMLLRDVVESIDEIADQAEDVGDSLAVAAIKRAL